MLAGVASSFAATSVAECPARTGCVNGDSFWPSPGPHELMLTPGASLGPSRSIAIGMLATYIHAPLRLRYAEAGPEADGQVPVVEHALIATMLLGYAPFPNVALGLALPVTLYQTGAGWAPIGGAPLSTSGLRDPRVTVAWSVVRTGSPGGKAEARVSSFGLAIRYTLSLPLGDRASLGGEPGPVFSPSVAADIRVGRFYAAAAGLARFRAQTEIFGAAHASQLGLAGGASVAILPQGRLALQAEAYVLASLRNRAESVAPAEWLFSVRTAALRRGEVAITLGAGAPIPVFASDVLAPQFRAVLSVEYAPSAAGNVDRVQAP